MGSKNRVKSSLMRRNLHKLLSNRLALVGLGIVLLLVVLSAFAPLFTKYDPSFIDVSQRLQKPSMEHLLGTDNVGRDLFARLLYGGRVSIFIGIVSALIAAAVGIIIGSVSGYFGGKIDMVLLYISEIVMSFPSMILVLVLVGFLGQGILNLIIIFTVVGWPSTYRIIRSRILSLREELFVESCRASGIGGASIMFNHLLPNALGPVVVIITLSTGGYVLAEAGLSFIGLGVASSVPTWGNIINAARNLRIMQNFPALWVAPGVAISLFSLGLSFFGDGLRDVFDPEE